MVLYKCDRCGYTNKIKSHFIKHLYRKYTCSPKKKNIPIEVLRNKYSSKDNTKSPSKLTTNKIKNTCSFCGRHFTRKDNLKVHLKNHCKHKYSSLELYGNTDSNILEVIKSQKKEWEQEKTELYGKIKDLVEKMADRNTIEIHQNIENQTNNYISLTGFGEENMEYITDTVNTKLLKKPGIMIQRLILFKHFHDGHPENHNIKIFTENNVQTFNQITNNWENKDLNDLVKALINVNYDHLENYYDKTGGKGLSIEQKDRVEVFVNKFKTGDNKLLNTVEKDTKLLITEQNKTELLINNEFESIHNESIHNESIMNEISNQNIKNTLYQNIPKSEINEVSNNK